MISEHFKPMEGRMTAFCGLDCDSCPAFLAKKYDDQSIRERTAKEWDVSPMEVNCDGCSTREGDLINFCRECKVRSCAIGKGVESCADCEDFICEDLESLFGIIGEEAKERLQQILPSEK
jgi:hypothetical protein